jgi:hypothetical protein
MNTNSVGEREGGTEMRALLCHCRCRLEAEDVKDLRELVQDHLRREHPAVAFSDEEVEGLVARSYRYEYVEAYAGGLDEEFGPEPY